MCPSPVGAGILGIKRDRLAPRLGTVLEEQIHRGLAFQGCELPVTMRGVQRSLAFRNPPASPSCAPTRSIFLRETCIPAFAPWLWSPCDHQLTHPLSLLGRSPISTKFPPEGLHQKPAPPVNQLGSSLELVQRALFWS